MGKHPWLLLVGAVALAIYMSACTDAVMGKVRGFSASHGEDRNDKRYGYRNSGSGTSRDYWSH